MSRVVFRGATVIRGDGSAPAIDMAIAAEDGTIVEVVPAQILQPVPGEVTVDLTGAFVMPLLINPHGHIGYWKDGTTGAQNYSRDNVLDHLRRLRYCGVGAMLSLGTDRGGTELTVRDEQRSGALSSPEYAELLTAGDGIVAQPSSGDNGGPTFATDVLHEVSTPEQARDVVRGLAADHVDAVKTWIDDRWGTRDKLGFDIAAAIASEAHTHGLLNIAHVYTLDDAKTASRAGVDGLAHLVRTPAPDDELFALMKERDQFVFSSLTIQKTFEGATEWLDDELVVETVPAHIRDRARSEVAALPQQQTAADLPAYQQLQESFRAFRDAGIRILLSGDTGLYYQIPGVTEHRELEAMVEAGMPPAEAIRAATSDPARLLGLHDRGLIEAGRRADLLVLHSNPLEDITATRRIREVVVAGDVLDRGRLRADIMKEHAE